MRSWRLADAGIDERFDSSRSITCMATKLLKEIRREIEIDGEPFTVAISPTGVKLTKKRFRSGRALSWRALWQSVEKDERSVPMEPTGAST
jgi:hypothetical protein